MGELMFSEDDIKQIESHGLTLDRVRSQVETFRKGLPFTILDRPATIGDGILKINEYELERLAGIFSEESAERELIKFVPASGEASRMFRLPHSFYNRYDEINQKIIRAEAEKGDIDHKTFLNFFENIKKFACYEDLKSVMKANGKDIEDHISKGQFNEILEYLLTSRGLNYADLPKGLIKFHRYTDHSRTPFEEHLVEAAAYARDRRGIARVHFTVAKEHERRINDHLENVRSKYEGEGVMLDIAFSIQRPSTDTIAVDLDYKPFRTNGNKLLFRAAGHGALLENLNDLRGDIVFIKNIDNVVPDRFTKEIYFYKKALAGYLMELQKEIFHYLGIMSRNDLDEEMTENILRFLKEKLSIFVPDDFEKPSREEMNKFIFSRLNRPIRVCGVVKNKGEPGGGPFWVKHGDGTLSLQIVESSQIDVENPDQKRIWESSTHFNPVDIVCGVRDYKGRQFDLRDFRDPSTAFISIRSKDGKYLKALELPGLWNGSMANWITVFIEVPLLTFNPVKTLLDLLREEHQNC
ncbi:MAG TPA: DUF4301 family protein [Thermodesulfobacteriota bacterium]